MDCLICFKLFIKEPSNDVGLSYPAILCKLLRLTSQSPVDQIFKESSICQKCHSRLENVHQLHLDLEEIEIKLNLVKSEIENELEESREIGEVYVQSGQSLSRTSLARCKLFDEIETQKKKNAQEHLTQVDVPQQECCSALDESASSSIQVQDSTQIQHNNGVVEIKMEESININEIFVDSNSSYHQQYDKNEETFKPSEPEPHNINQNEDNLSISSEVNKITTTVPIPSTTHTPSTTTTPISLITPTITPIPSPRPTSTTAPKPSTSTTPKPKPKPSTTTTIPPKPSTTTNTHKPSTATTTTPSKKVEDDPAIKHISVKMKKQTLLESSPSKAPPSTTANDGVVRLVPLQQLQETNADEVISVNLNDDQDYYTRLELKEFTISLERLELPLPKPNPAAPDANANELNAPYDINEEPIASYMKWSEMKIRELQKTRNFKPMKISLRHRNRKPIKIARITKQGSRKSRRELSMLKAKEKAKVKNSPETESEEEKDEDLKCLFGGCEFYGKNKRGLRVHRFLKHKICEKDGKISNNTNDVETECEDDSNKSDQLVAIRRRKRKRRSFANFSKPKLKCKICRSTNTFSSKASLDRHILGHKAASGKCTICNEEFPSSSALIAHWRIHKQTFDCTSCEKSFLRVIDYNKHKEGESKESKFPCSECDQIYENENCLKFHCTKKHPKYQCTFCLKRFSINQQLQKHLGLLSSKSNRNKSKEVFKCSLCSTTAEFENRNCFRYHMEVNHPNSFKCELCSDFKCSSASSLKIHRKSVHKISIPRLRIKRRFNNRDEKHECHICNRVFKTCYSLSNHVSKIVEGDIHSCPFCLVIFPSPLCLRHHETTQHVNETAKEDESSDPRSNENEKKTRVKRQFNCLVCKKTFPFRHLLRVHAMVHTGLKPIICPVENCGKAFRIKELLKTHQLMVHSTIFPFPCTHDSCEKRYADETLLKRHVYRCHSNNKFYKCRFPNCGEKFDLITAKNEHQVSQHGYISKGKSKSKNAQKILINCEYCKEGFKTENAKLEHESIHTKVRNFICTQEDCGKKFWKLSNLKNHQLSHSIKRFKCDICYDVFNSQGRLNIHYNYHTRERKFRCKFCSKVYYSASNLFSHNKKNHQLKSTGVNKNKKRKLNFKKKIEIESDIEIDESEILNGNLVANDGEMEVESPQAQDFVNDDKEKLKLFCGICHSNFPDFTSLEAHLKVHSKPKRKTTENK